MDFYITNYQGKAMESLTPLFRSMTDGVHRLEQQEEQEEAEAESARKAAADETGLEPARKQQKTMEDIARRARRLTIRLASMANRCFWVSAAELTVHILTDGDCLQSHNNLTVFTRTLQWAVQQSAAVRVQQVQAMALRQTAHRSQKQRQTRRRRQK